MAATNTTTSTTQQPIEPSADDLSAKAVHKRFEGLIMVRTRAIKGKGAWYWAHLEPILINNSDTGLAKAVKLRCSLCSAVFSASNPSRTATEHLKRGTCPNFNSPSNPNPISSVSPPSSSQNHRKRPAASGGGGRASYHHVTPLSIVDPSRFSVELAYPPTPAVQNHQHLILSGGKEDFSALAMLEDSVKKLKSPKASPSPVLTKTQIDTSLDFLTDWVYECCGSVSLTSLDHPKFKSFLNQVGLPSLSRRDFIGARLDSKYEETKAESEAKIRDAMFFQISSNGWKSKHQGEENFINLSVNLPNGTSVFRRAVFTTGSIPSKYAEEVLWDTIRGVCGNSVQQCVGIVSDRFKSKALKNLENQHHWLVNLSCQFQAFISLIKDFIKDFPLLNNLIDNCLKLAKFVNNKTQIRHAFHKYQLQEYNQARLLRIPSKHSQRTNFGPIETLIEDILSSARALQLVLIDESFKIVSIDDSSSKEIEDMMRDPRFWNELEAVHSLFNLIKGMAREIERDKPLVGQCLPLWDELRRKVKDWCLKFNIVETTLIEKIIERRFKKNYHPAWAAAFILDPLYLIRDSSGKYMPPFKCLTSEQEKDVDKIITRLVSREEAHIVLMELMKWRSEGLDPVYAQAVQMKVRDSNTGKMKIANPQSSRLVWETHLTQFKSLGKVAVRIIFLHSTSCGFKCNLSLLRWIHLTSAMDRAQKMIFIAAHSKLDNTKDDEENEIELFSLTNGEDHHDVFF
ncbi:uncharacterized protein LOC124943994 [Impatiens glandulifera]|uniref:uncharacterized protein LOC124943994 n=1 Tax=Impatiens glandulifera TaxID=253017 RepID=UPI001FB1008E|nr:uncharacterized protein LOC124943994 [Impatiens glandulifera]